MLNVSGHLMSTAQVESVLVEHPWIAEAAVVGKKHDVKGECLYCFVTVKDGASYSEALEQELCKSIRQKIGALATPDFIQVRCVETSTNLLWLFLNHLLLTVVHNGTKNTAMMMMIMRGEMEVSENCIKCNLVRTQRQVKNEVRVWIGISLEWQMDMHATSGTIRLVWTWRRRF